MAHSSVRGAASEPRRGSSADASLPHICLLSNGSYTVMLTEAGSGYSARDGLDVTRWREDATRDCWGQHYYIRDLDGRRAWSTGRQPLGGDADTYEAFLQLNLGAGVKRGVEAPGGRELGERLFRRTEIGGPAGLVSRIRSRDERPDQ